MSAQLFAKEFQTSVGQVIAMARTDEDNEPELRLYFRLPGLGVCEQAFSYHDTDDGYERRDAAFAGLTQEDVEGIVSEVAEITSKAGLPA